MQEWARDQAGRLTGLVGDCLPGEQLTEDELVACCWDDPGVVLALDDGSAAVAAVARGATAFVRLLVVAPHARRLGHGRALVAEAEQWARAAGCRAMVPGPSAPFYLWPGVDVHATGALCLFESFGFQPRGCEVNMSFPTRHRAAVPPGVTLRRALEEDDVAAGLAFVGRHWPNWVAECRRAVEHGACHLAWDGAEGGGIGDGNGRGRGEVVGFGCHSVNRLGWLGPMGTDPVRRHGGLGNALLGAIATDLMAAGLESVEVAWVGPVGFYANAAGATVSRTFRTLVKPSR
jgi:GNAT superfamily N-acetyltransferase